MSLRLPDPTLFELLRPPPPRWRKALLVSAAVLAIAGGGWALWQWRHLQLTQSRVIALEAETQREAERTAQTAADSKAIILAAENAASALQAFAARRMAEIEACHPAGAQVQSMALDVASGHAAMEVAVQGETDLVGWARCLNGSDLEALWHVVRIDAATSAGKPTSVNWVRKQSETRSDMGKVGR